MKKRKIEGIASQQEKSESVAFHPAVFSNPFNPRDGFLHASANPLDRTPGKYGLFSERIASKNKHFSFLPTIYEIDEEQESCDAQKVAVGDGYFSDDEGYSDAKVSLNESFFNKRSPSPACEISAEYSEDESNFSDDEDVYFKLPQVKTPRPRYTEETSASSKKLRYDAVPSQDYLDPQKKLAESNLAELSLEDLELFEESTEENVEMQRIIDKLKKLLVPSPIYPPLGAFFTGDHHFSEEAQEVKPSWEIRRPKPSRPGDLDCLSVASITQAPEESTRSSSKRP